MRVTDKLTPMAAAMSALATLACCLPLGIGGAVGALGLSVALERLRPWLIGLAVILLGLATRITASSSRAPGHGPPAKT
jgi:hypothetical protein